MGINGIDPTNGNSGKQNVHDSDSVKTNHAEPSIYMEEDWAHKIIKDVESKMTPEELDKKNIGILKDLVDIADKIKYGNATSQTFFSWAETDEQIHSIKINYATEEKPTYEINDYLYTTDDPKYKEVEKLFNKLLKNATEE